MSNYALILAISGIVSACLYWAMIYDLSWKHFDRRYLSFLEVFSLLLSGVACNGLAIWGVVYLVKLIF